MVQYEKLIILAIKKLTAPLRNIKVTYAAESTGEY